MSSLILLTNQKGLSNSSLSNWSLEFFTFRSLEVINNVEGYILDESMYFVCRKKLNVTFFPLKVTYSVTFRRTSCIFKGDKTACRWYMPLVRVAKTQPISRWQKKANKIYIFEEGGIIDSIRVFEFNFRNRNVHRHWSVAFRIQLYIPGDGYRPATGVYGNDTPSWIFRNHRTCARRIDTSPQILTLQIYEIEPAAAHLEIVCHAGLR